MNEKKNQDKLKREKNTKKRNRKRNKIARKSRKRNYKNAKAGCLFTILALMFTCCSKRHKPDPVDSVFKEIEYMKDLHLVKYNFEEVIAIQKKQRLKVMLVVPASISAYADLSAIKFEKQDSTLLVGLPGVDLGEVSTDLDSAQVFPVEKWGIVISNGPYKEAVQDIKNGIAQLRTDIEAKAIRQGIIEEAENELKIFMRSLLASITDRRISFIVQDSIQL